MWILECAYIYLFFYLHKKFLCTFICLKRKLNNAKFSLLDMHFIYLTEDYVWNQEMNFKADQLGFYLNCGCTITRIHNIDY